MITNRDMVIVDHSIAKMFKDSHFSICTIDKCMKVLNVKPEQKVYNQLSALHCVDYSDMSDELLKEVQNMVREIFNVKRMVPDNFSVFGPELAIANHLSPTVSIGDKQT